MNKPKTSTTNAAVLVAAKEFGVTKVKVAGLAQIMKSLQSNLRRPTAHAKTRGEVAGTTRKPWRQKGTGRARVGTRRNPVWRGGGAAFGPLSSRNFNKKTNAVMMTPALLTLLSSKAKAGEIFELSEFPEKITTTKQAAAALSGIADAKSNLIVLSEINPELSRAMRNLSYVKPITAQNVNFLNTVTSRRIIFLPKALNAFKKCRIK